METDWKAIDRIDISIHEERRTFTARIRAKGLTAYGRTYREAVEKLLRMREAVLRSRNAPEH